MAHTLKYYNKNVHITYKNTTNKTPLIQHHLTKDPNVTTGDNTDITNLTIPKIFMISYFASHFCECIYKAMHLFCKSFISLHTLSRFSMTCSAMSTFLSLGAWLPVDVEEGIDDRSLHQLQNLHIPLGQTKTNFSLLLFSLDSVNFTTVSAHIYISYSDSSTPLFHPNFEHLYSRKMPPFVQ